MAGTVPLHKRKTLIPRRKIHKYTNEIADEEEQMFPCYFIIMIPNTIGMFARAYRRHDYSLAVLGLMVILTLALYDCCLPLYLSIPKNEKSSRKSWLKLTMWLLYTALSFGFVYEFGHFLSLRITVALYAGALVCSVFLLCEFVIVDFVDFRKSRNSGEHGSRSFETLDAGELKDSDSVLEKV